MRTRPLVTPRSGPFLVRILFLNLAVALAKIVFGQLSGSISILSDGFHSLTDGASNVVALVGLRLAGKPPDANHPYGHRKFETLAAGGIALFLLLVVVEVAQAAFFRLRSGGAPSVTGASFAIMLATLATNILVVRAERRAAYRLSSELLLADARHTQSDVLTSLAVIAALAGSAYGYPILDPLAAIVIVGFIGYAGFEIARDAAQNPVGPDCDLRRRRQARGAERASRARLPPDPVARLGGSRVSRSSRVARWRDAAERRTCALARGEGRVDAALSADRGRDYSH